MSRFVFAALLAGAALTGFGTSANAALNAKPAGLTNQPSVMQPVQVGERCGRGRHFVRPHRYHGQWVRGYCVPNRRHFRGRDPRGPGFHRP